MFCFFVLTGRRHWGEVWYYCSTLPQFLITSKCTYPRSPPLLIWYKLVSLYTERHSIGLHKLISIVASLSTDSLHAWLSPKVNLKPLIPIPVFSNPPSLGGTVVSCMKSGIPGTIKMVVHGGGGKHRWGNSAILHPQRNIAGIYPKR